MSPYLFLLCVEGLSCLFHGAEKRKSISDLSIAKHSPLISHLFFVDDSIIFFKAVPVEGAAVCSILHWYERASGQTINFEKSVISFSLNTGSEVIHDITHFFGVRQTRRH